MTIWGYVNWLVLLLPMNLPQAIENHKKALALDVNFKEAWTSMGQTYKDWGKFDEAIECLDKVSTILLLFLTASGTCY